MLDQETVPLVSGLPVRTRRFVYIVMVLFGITSLLPWNIIITAHGYYAEKFNEANHPTIIHNFPSYFQIVGIGSYFVLSLFAVCFLKPINLTSNIYVCNGMVLAIFMLVTALSRIDTSHWSDYFFVLSLVLFGLSLAFSAVYMSALMALCVLLTPTAIQGFYLGQGVAGLFAIILSLVTLSIPHADPVTAGFYYFFVTAVCLAISLIAFYLFNKHHCVSECIHSAADHIIEPPKSKQLKKAGIIQQIRQIPAVSVFTSIRKLCFVTMMTSTITSCCFPAALSTLMSTSSHTESVWVTTYFLPVAVFLFFALGDVLGRVTSCIISLPSRRYLLHAAFLRLFAIPAIFMCNLHPRGSWLPVLFSSDVCPPIFTLILSWSNGHVQSLAAFYASLQVQSDKEKSAAGTLISFSYAIGLFSGSVLVFIMTALLNL